MLKAFLKKILREQYAKYKKYITAGIVFLFGLVTYYLGWLIGRERKE